MQKGAMTAMQKFAMRKEATGPVLRFSPTAWAKLLFLRDYGQTEVGGFGITPADDLLYVEDVRLVKQVCSWAHVAFDDESVADLFDEQFDAGRRPEQVGRLWIHTHPADCPRPSQTDEETFARVFGRADWAVMFILAREGATFARLRFNVGPGSEQEISVRTDYSRPFPGCDVDAWEQEYLANVRSDEIHSFGPINGAADIAELREAIEFGWIDETEALQLLQGASDL